MEHYDKVRKEFCELYKNDGFEYRGVDDYIYTNRMKECLAMKQNFKSTIEPADVEKIEQYAIMLASDVVPVHSIIFYYFEHYKDERFKYCVEKFYHVKRKDIWKLTGAEQDNDVMKLEALKEKRAYLEKILELEKRLAEAGL